MLGWTLSNLCISCRIATTLAFTVAGCWYVDVDDPRRAFMLLLVDQTIRSQHYSLLLESAEHATKPDVHVKPAWQRDHAQLVWKWNLFWK